MKNRKMHRILLSGLLALLLAMGAGCGQPKAALQARDYALIDLHLHLDGSISVSTARELAQMQSIQLPESDDELRRMLQVDDDCQDLNEYLEKFDLTVSLLQTREAISTAVANLERELQAEGLIYAEIRFAPQLHTQQGLTQAEIVEAAIEGMGRCDFRSSLILCCMRGDDNHKENLETVQVAKDYLGKGAAALDIAGAEALFPTEDFGELFRLAQQLGVPYTIHAGEADGPDSVEDALAFGTRRIGHGVRSVEDKALVEKLAREGIFLELCPTSNLNTAIFDSLSEYPLPALLEAGVRATINTDNRIVSNTQLQQEFQKLMDTFPLTHEQLRTLVQNAADAAFADEQTKSWLNGEIEKRLGK